MFLICLWYGYVCVVLFCGVGWWIVFWVCCCVVLYFLVVVELVDLVVGRVVWYCVVCVFVVLCCIYGGRENIEGIGVVDCCVVWLCDWFDVVCGVWWSWVFCGWYY